MKKVVALVGVLVLAATMASAINGTNTARKAFIEDTYIVPLHKTITASNLQENVQISTGEENDITPTITVDGAGRIVVSYVSQASILEHYVYIAYSEDGSTWEIPAYVYTESGVAASPYLDYMPGTDKVTLSYVDPGTNEYAVHAWYIGDITDTETYDGVRWGWMSGENYQYVASTGVEYLFLQMVLCDEPDRGLYGVPTLIYWTPDWDHPSEIGGGYYDGQSILKTAPSIDPEMDTGANKMIMVMQHNNETTGHSEIAYKMTVTDLDLLLTPGGGPGGMDKYADIEVWPWQGYLGKGNADSAHPSVSASGSSFVVVYMNNDNVYGDWDIMCAYSHDDGETWETSVVAGEHPVDETYPAVYMMGNTVYVVYIKEGNLYLVKSKDGGATWSEPEQINDADGSVVAGENYVDICSKGIVWVDNRNGNNDIYFAPLPAPIIKVSISGGFGVKAVVSNEGSEAAENVPWSVDLTGLVFVGKHSEGTIDTLNPGESVTVGPGLVFGFGPTTITANVGGTTATASGFVLGPLVLGVS